jgi:hypothetical protein
MALQAPFVGNTICQVNALSVSGTSELIRIANLQIFGAESNITGVGRNYYSRCTWQGSAGTPHVINIGAGVSKYQTFENCEFDQYCTINISAFLGSVIYFINCNFGGATLNLNHNPAVPVIFNNCAGFVSFPTNAILVGMNVLVAGESLNTATTTDSTTIKLKYLDITSGNTSSSVNQVITTDGVAGLKLTEIGGPSSFYNVFYETLNYPASLSGATLTLFEVSNQANILPSLATVINFNSNFSFTLAPQVAIFKLINTGTGGELQSFRQT